jgi:long-chain acyl-CoA synthetase
MAVKIGERLAGIFERNSARTLLWDEINERSYTYQEVLDRAVLLAWRLSELGAKSGDKIGLCLPNGANFLISYISCLAADFTAVPVNILTGARDREFVVNNAGFKILIDSESTKHFVPERSELIRLTLTEDCFSATASFMEPFSQLEDDSVISIHFTSGTTGLPKGVCHFAKGLIENASDFNAVHGASSDSNFLHVMPMGYMAGYLNTFICPLMAEGSVTIAPMFDAASLLRFWEPVLKREANVFWLSPTMLASLAKLSRDERGLKYCKGRRPQIFVGTAPLAQATRKAFEDRFQLKVFESYGLSELLLISAQDESDQDRSVGRPLPRVELTLAEDGEIMVRTPYLAAGYLDTANGNPELLPRDYLFPTGDIGELSDERSITITGRKKDLIIKGGVNISPRAVEETILLYPGVKQVAVLGIPHEFYGEDVVAALMLDDDLELASILSGLKEFCRGRLSASELPSRFVQLEQFPATSTGKIQKGLIKELVMKA